MIFLTDSKVESYNPFNFHFSRHLHQLHLTLTIFHAKMNPYPMINSRYKKNYCLETLYLHVELLEYEVFYPFFGIQNLNLNLQISLVTSLQEIYHSAISINYLILFFGFIKLLFIFLHPDLLF